MRVSYQPPPDPYQSAAPRPAAPAGQYSPDGRWYWNGQQWIPVTIPGPPWARPYGPPEGRAAAAVALVAMATAGSVLFFWGEGIYLIAASTGDAWWTLVGPLVMSVLLIRVSGKQLLEHHMRKRPGYPEYIARTSGFFPLPPRRARK